VDEMKEMKQLMTSMKEEMTSMKTVLMDGVKGQDGVEGQKEVKVEAGSGRGGFLLKFFA
jgi:hypothetical protein